MCLIEGHLECRLEVDSDDVWNKEGALQGVASSGGLRGWGGRSGELDESLGDARLESRKGEFSSLIVNPRSEASRIHAVPFRAIAFVKAKNVTHFKFPQLDCVLLFALI